MPAFVAGQPRPKVSGIRVKRGLYRAMSGVIVNADVNGSANIGRKVIQNSKFLARLDRSLAARPVRIDPLKVFFRNNGEKTVEASNLAYQERYNER